MCLAPPLPASWRAGKDSIAILATDTWEVLNRFATATRDLVDIKWVRERGILGWDTNLQVRPPPSARIGSPRARPPLEIVLVTLQYLVVMYSFDGRLIGRYSAYANALGVKAIAISPQPQILAIGSFDNKVARVLARVTVRRFVLSTR